MLTTAAPAERVSHHLFPGQLSVEPVAVAVVYVMAHLQTLVQQQTGVEQQLHLQELPERLAQQIKAVVAVAALTEEPVAQVVLEL
jgi:hypothetical protein